MTSDSKKCYNCDTPLEVEDKYCWKCSQKYTTGRVTFGKLVGEFFSEQFNLDSRILQTVGAIFIPGKLTEEFFRGRHKSYVSPLRLFLVMGVIFVSVLVYGIFKGEDVQFFGNSEILDIAHENERRKLLHIMDSLHVTEKNNFDNKKVAAALDSVSVKLWETLNNKEDSININNTISLGSFNFPTISRIDFERMSASELGQTYGKEMQWWEKLVFTQGVKTVKKGENLLQYFFGKSTLALFLMMPFLAAFLKIMYVRRRFYYVEHLVFSFHFHTFLFLLFSVITLAVPYSTSALIPIGFLIAFVYLFLSMKRIYKQRWFKTLIKIFIIGFFYTFLLSFFMLFTVAIGFLLF